MSTDTISVHEGVANINPSIFRHRLVASTCPTTLPRDGGSVEYSFRLMPKKDSTNDLVLVERRHADSKPRLDLFHIRREDGKVVVKENPRDVRDMVGAEFNYQVRDSSIELRIRTTRFTNDASATAINGESVVVVDAESILKFIAGYIGVRKLRSAGRRLQKRRDALRELQETLAWAGARLAECQTELARERAAAKVAASVETETLRKNLRAFRNTALDSFPLFFGATVLKGIDEVLHGKLGRS